MFNKTDFKNWAAEIKNGNRTALSKAITLVESHKSEDKTASKSLFKELKSFPNNSLRIGITGPPGSGKSTLIEALGLELIKTGNTVAVLSIDPSSAFSKGSILGDKTRMQNLSLQDKAFIRPSPAGEHLGGVAQRTRESIWLCEAAAFDFIIVETAGIGQSEYQVSTMTDLTILLTLPGSGDELQGIKKGVLEWADIIVLNKADDADDPKIVASYRDLVATNHFIESKTAGWIRKIIQTSALNLKGIDVLMAEILNFKAFIIQQGYRDVLRMNQLKNHYSDLLKIGLWEQTSDDLEVREFIEKTEKKLIDLEINPEEAADISIKFIFAHFNKKDR